MNLMRASDAAHVTVLVAEISLNPSRCHRITVAGLTIAGASLQLAHPCGRITQKARSQSPTRRRSPRARVEHSLRDATSRGGASVVPTEISVRRGTPWELCELTLLRDFDLGEPVATSTLLAR
jgi:hypothetical protein